MSEFLYGSPRSKGPSVYEDWREKREARKERLNSLSPEERKTERIKRARQLGKETLVTAAVLTTAAAGMIALNKKTHIISGFPGEKQPAREKPGGVDSTSHLDKFMQERGITIQQK